MHWMIMKITNPEQLKETVKYIGMTFLEYHTIRQLAKNLKAKAIHIKEK